MKKFLLFLAILSLTLVAACSNTITAGQGSANPTSPNTVHMNETLFLPETITIKKGDTITMVDDVSVIHIIQNGTWDSNGSSKPGTESGAPQVQLQFQGNDTQKAGPFNTAGTFHLYCTVHPGMNLTITVK